MISYGFTHDTGCGSSSVTGCSSPIEAKIKAYRMSIACGWEPPKLRDHWWQFWRPKSWPEGMAEAAESLRER